MADGTVQDMIDPVEKVLADYPALYADSYGDSFWQMESAVRHLGESPAQRGWVRMYASDGTFTGIFSGMRGRRNTIR